MTVIFQYFGVLTQFLNLVYIKGKLMKLSKLAMATVFAVSAASSFTAMAENANTGKVTFTGSVVNTPCNIEAEDLNQEVKFGQLSKTALKNGVKSEKDFSINLVDCDFNSFTSGTTGGATPKKLTGMNIVFTSANGGYVGASNAMIPTSPESNSNNLGISIDGITFGQSSELPMPDLNATKHALNFTALAQAIEAGKDVTEGDFKATANFRITYE